MIPLDEDGNEQSWADPDVGISMAILREYERPFVKTLMAKSAVEAIKLFGIQPDSYAWRCWWETQ